MPGSISAPGGQLVQATDRYVGTLRARLVLIDDTGIRATMTASWLKQMGWADVAVLDNGLTNHDLEKGPRAVPVLGFDDVDVDKVSPQALIQRSAGGVTVIDLSSSRNYYKRHIPDSWFALRSRLATALAKLPAAPLLVLTSEDGVLARLAAPEAAALSATPVKVLDGGNAAWAAAGLALAQGFENMASDADDVWLRPYDRDAGTDDAMQQYLSWEVGLVQQIEHDGTARFRPSKPFQ